MEMLIWERCEDEGENSLDLGGLEDEERRERGPLVGTKEFPTLSSLVETVRSLPSVPEGQGIRPVAQAEVHQETTWRLLPETISLLITDFEEAVRGLAA